MDEDNLVSTVVTKKKRPMSEEHRAKNAINLQKARAVRASRIEERKKLQMEEENADSDDEYVLKIKNKKKDIKKDKPTKIASIKIDAEPVIEDVKFSPSLSVEGGLPIPKRSPSPENNINILSEIRIIKDYMISADENRRAKISKKKSIKKV